MTRSVGIHIPFMVWIIKNNIFPIFYLKIWKIALQPMATSNSYNSGTFEDTLMLFEQTRGFRGRAIEWCPSNLPLTDPCCHGNQPPLFKHKIGNNSACMGDTNPIPGPSRGLSGLANLTVLLKFVPDQPLLPLQPKFENFNRKLAITRLVWEIRPPFLDLVGGYRGRRI